MVLARGMIGQDPNPAGILIQMVILPTRTHIQCLKQQVCITADKMFIGLIAKAAFLKFSHCYLLILVAMSGSPAALMHRNIIQRNAGWRRILWKSSSLISSGEQTCASTGSCQRVALPCQCSRGRCSFSLKYFVSTD